MVKKSPKQALDKLDEILEDPSKVLTEVTFQIKNEGYKPDDPITEEGFEIPKDFIAGMYKNAKGTDAGEIIATFSNCRTLGGATVVVTVRMPE